MCMRYTKNASIDCIRVQTGKKVFVCCPYHIWLLFLLSLAMSSFFTLNAIPCHLSHSFSIVCFAIHIQPQAQITFSSFYSRSFAIIQSQSGIYIYCFIRYTLPDVFPCHLYLGEGVKTSKPIWW